ncbi:16S rRNA (cytosine(967)-C(5))-methyltransferase RsmB [Sporolactobacillus sp. CPB3-1]|uniref:16S rRNA (cytosine(967)-C(5))-methyltransferase n=1 Tax=Sporolactobacillus mangiferae TaxID=2940498 RepID=A0ABT0M8E5_9BACL|nr:16S rRNA (cytosine(967)-C(5))-methyltransferase RsmB [Sporolactobacillus mangiferae]MCL1630908.1 16S rRNA (cytosine(967)-C(5))-methyltransferase RsmB [Sporolactobacillus mangiferae]
MKRRETARETALNLLMSVVRDGAYSQIALNDALNDGQLSDRDKALVTTLVYGVLQRKLTLAYYLSYFVDRKRRIDDWVEMLLYMSFYQKAFLDRIPDHAMVNEAVMIAKKRGHQGIAGFVNGVLRKMLREGLPDPSVIESPERRMAIQNSHPEWMMHLWTEQWGQEVAVRIAEADNVPPSVSVRVNRLKGSPEELVKRLAAEGVSAVHGHLSRDGLIIKGGHAAGTDAFQEGLFTIQDESSMLVADAVAPKAGMHILDACAGPGGKTTHLAERLKNTGKVVALDLHPHKTQLIERSATRLGLNNIETLAMDARCTRAHFADATFDRVLLDVPCSGLGVIRRKPEIKWSKTADEIKGLIPIQRRLLDETASLVTPGGWLIYSTCTIHKEENERQISAFLAKHPEFQAEPTFSERMPRKEMDSPAGTLQVMPYMFHSDGFFISCLRRKG